MAAATATFISLPSATSVPPAAALFAATTDYNLRCPNFCPFLLPNSYMRYPNDFSATPSGSTSSLSPLLALISILTAAFLLVLYYALSMSSFFRRNNRGSGSPWSDPALEALIGKEDEYSGR